jgi:hypothetical protein
MKQSIARIAVVVWIISVFMAVLCLSIPPANLPLYVGLSLIAIIPIVLGSRYYRTFGIIAFAISVFLIVQEYSAGIRFHSRWDPILEKLKEQGSATNVPSTNPPKP